MDNNLNKTSSQSLRSNMLLPSIKEENEDKFSVLVDRLEDAISLIKLRENEIKRLDQTINQLNEISTNLKIDQIQTKNEHLNKKDKRHNNVSLTIAISLTITAIIALVILIIGFGVLIAVIFEK